MTNVGKPAPQTGCVGDAALRANGELATRLWTGLICVVFLVFVVGGWSATAKLSGAVVANGTVVVDSSVKRVQHASGGIVSKILVRNGDRVKAGQVLLRLDDTQVRANLGVFTSQLIQLRGRKARLIGVRDNLEDLVFPAGFLELGPEAQHVAAGERRLHAAKRAAMEGSKAQLNARIGQLELQIDGLTAQRDAKARELELIRQEEARVQDMRGRKLVPVTRLLAIQRDVTRVAGEHGTLIARIGSSGGQISEIKLQILSLDDDARSQSQEMLREAEARIAELQERQIAARDQLERVDITAPQPGIVHDLAVHTLGGVIGAGEQILLIVPQDDALRVEATIDRRDIDQVAQGQIVKLRFPSFNQRTTPEVEGTVLRISADLTTDNRTGFTHYVARIALNRDGYGLLSGLRLIPGMPVEAFIETKPRTVLSYLVKPISDNFKRTFRDN